MLWCNDYILQNLSTTGVLCILSWVCFMRSYDGDFVFDDVEAIVNNKDVTPESPITDLFWHDFWGQNISKQTSHKSYRPLTMLTFRMNYALSGGLHPVSFHLLNIVLHSVVASILYKVLCKVFAVELTYPGRNVPWITTLLFTVHPVHTEAVCGIVGRAELLCAIMFLLSLNFYINACHTEVSCDKLWSLWLCFLCCLLSVLCKEQGITVLGVCCIYEVLLMRRWKHKKLFHILAEMCSTKSFVLDAGFLCVSGVLLLAFRWWIMAGSPPTFQPVDNPHSFVNSTFYRVLNYQYLYALNVWLCLCPWWLCFDWSMGCVPIIHSLLDVRILAVLGLWTTLLALVYASLSLTNFNRHVLFAMGLTLVPFLPSSNVLFQVGFVVAERVLYLPSAGFCLLFTLSFHHVNKAFPKYRSVVQWCVYLVVLLYVVQCVRRSGDWETERRLFESGQHVCPLNAKVHYNIGKVRADQGDHVRAIYEYRLAIRLNPDYDQALNNLGNILKEKGQLQEALELLQRATQIRASFAAAWMNLGIVQAALNLTEAAETSYLTAIHHRHKYPDCFYNLGNLYLAESRHPAALTAWRNVTLQNPHHVNAWFNLLNLLDNLDNFQDLQVLAQESLKWNPGEASLHYSYANGLGKAGQYESSEAHFLAAIKLKPDSGKFYSNLGYLMYLKLCSNDPLSSGSLLQSFKRPVSQVGEVQPGRRSLRAGIEAGATQYSHSQTSPHAAEKDAKPAENLE